MIVNREQKSAEVENLKKRLEGCETIVVAQYSGLTVAQMTELRTKSYEAGADGFKVTKNTLMKIALKDTPYEGISELFAGPVGIAVSNDPVSAAKALHEFAKDNEKLVIRGGIMGATVLDAKGVQALAKMPSLDELRGKIIGILQTPAQQIARVLQAPAQNMVGVTKAYGEKS